MITIRKEIQSEIVFMNMEDMVPEDSIFRKIDKYIDFTFIYDEVKDLYCEDNGRPSIDPVVLFKLLFIQAQKYGMLNDEFFMDSTHRKTTVERSFRDSKQNHGYRYILFKGVEKNQAYTHLICAAQNMKNISIKQYNIEKRKIINDIIGKITNFIKFRNNLWHKKTPVSKLGFVYTLKRIIHPLHHLHRCHYSL